MYSHLIVPVIKKFHVFITPNFSSERRKNHLALIRTYGYLFFTFHSASARNYILRKFMYINQIDPYNP